MSWGLIPMRAMERCPGMKLFQYLPSNDISTKPVKIWCEWTYPIMLVLLLSLTRLGTERGPKALDAETHTYSIPIAEGAEFMIGVPWCNHNTKATRNLQCPPLEPKTETSGTDSAQPTEWVQLQTLVNFLSVPVTASCRLLGWSWIQAEVQHCTEGKVHLRRCSDFEPWSYSRSGKNILRISSFLQSSSKVLGGEGRVGRPKASFQVNWNIPFHFTPHICACTCKSWVRSFI